MAYKEWLIDWLSKTFSRAKPQRRKGGSKSLCVFFAPLRLCARSSSFLVLLLLTIPCAAQPRQPMRQPDILRVSNVTDAQISPNGQWVVYTVSSVDEDQSLTSLWLVRLSLESYAAPLPTPTPRRPTSPASPSADWPDIRSTPRQLLPSGWNASTPRWSPDSNSIAFLARHDDLNGLWTVKLDKPEPRFLASITSTNF